MMHWLVPRKTNSTHGAMTHGGLPRRTGNRIYGATTHGLLPTKSTTHGMLRRRSSSTHGRMTHGVVPGRGKRCNERCRRRLANLIDTRSRVILTQTLNKNCIHPDNLFSV